MSKRPSALHRIKRAELAGGLAAVRELLEAHSRDCLKCSAGVDPLRMCDEGYRLAVAERQAKAALDRWDAPLAEAQAARLF